MLSLCVLTRNQIEGVGRLLDSVRCVVDDLVIGDNSNHQNAIDHFSDLADEYFTISDEMLWTDGFGPVKQRIVSRAKNKWVIVADPDEEWDVNFDVLDLVRADVAPVFKTRMWSDNSWVEHGRVFDRSLIRLLGIIHESPYHRKTRKHWSRIAHSSHFARITHYPAQLDNGYHLRKQILYNNLLYKAYTNSILRHGIDRWWFDVYMKGLLEKGWEPTSFEEWAKIAD